MPSCMLVPARHRSATNLHLTPKGGTPVCVVGKVKSKLVHSLRFAHPFTPRLTPRVRSTNLIALAKCHRESRNNDQHWEDVHCALCIVQYNAVQMSAQLVRWNMKTIRQDCRSLWEKCQESAGSRLGYSLLSGKGLVDCELQNQKCWLIHLLLWEDCMLICTRIERGQASSERCS